MSRHWENIICYEDRSDHLTTTRWRLSGISTKEDSENTDSGVLWLKTTKSGDTVTCKLYKDDACADANEVATGSGDVSGLTNTGEDSVEIALSASQSSGMGGSFWIRDYIGDDTCPLQVALCTDEDMDALQDAIESLPGYDLTEGCAEFIRVAGDDVIGKVSALYRENIGGFGTPEAWFITDAYREYPDLRMIANPSQLRLACAHRALAIAFGRHHEMADMTMYSQLRDYHNTEFAGAMQSLVLTFKSGSGDDANEVDSGHVINQQRV
ncbi:MAG: hypothetical protein KAV00_06800 [Phycisphaerae bacterium]|nr:hypothetical protein [Phycisphaerae bacterium]